MTDISKTNVRFDPVLNHNFVIGLVEATDAPLNAQSIAMSSINNLAVGGFSECSGLEMTMDPEEYLEGGRNGNALKFASRVKWGNITLKKGLGINSALWDWHYGFVKGQGKRMDGVIILINDRRVPAAIWSFKKGLPVKYSGPSMNANENNVAIETIEIAHEGIYQLPNVALGAAGAMTTSELVT